VCARGDGIRRSKDLRAGVKKYLILTNERKKMSTKTLRKRISTVALTALTASVLSVIAIPSANADIRDGVFDSQAGSIGVVGAISPSLATDTDGATTRTATVLSTGQLVLSTSAAATAKVSAGGLITAATDASDINGTQTCVAGLAAGDTFTVKPVGAAGSTFTITSYDDQSCDSPGAIADVITVTIAAASVAGTASTSESVVRWDSDNSGSEPTAAEDVTNSSTTTGNTLELYIDLEDAYGQDIDGTDGALILTASSGAYIGTPNTSGAVVATAATSTVVSTLAPSPIWAVVSEATAGAGWNGTVTVSYNGVVIATKSGKITGAASKITVSPYKIGITGGTAGIDTHLYSVTDAAGNALAFTSSNLSMTSSSNSAILSGIGAGTDATPGSAYGSNVGAIRTTCVGSSSGVAGGGTVDVVVQTTLSNGTVVKSAPFKATCGGNAYSYKASLDKASYVQGEVATMTVSFTDSKGNLANSTTAVGTGASTNDATISAPMMAMVGTMGNGADMKPGVSGTLTYKFTVGTSNGLTAGAYNAVVSFPTLAYADAVSVAYKVSTGTSTVTNEEVLKSIVALIASINKQIQALQKLILRR
jgi:hypothetical protein